MLKMSLVLSLLIVPTAMATQLVSTVVDTSSPDAGQIELKNDVYVESGAPAYLQQGFVQGEMAGVWVKVPTTVKKFKVDAFRVLVGGGQNQALTVFFHMAIKEDGKYAPVLVPDISNAAQITVGNYFNDIPAEGSNGSLGCATPGQLIGAALEFTHDGLPSVYRDAGPITAPANLINAVPGGWSYSANYGVTGNWILRVVGHEARPGECQT